MDELSTGESFLRSILDAFASPVLVVDRGLTIREANRAARDLISSETDVVLRRLSGEILHCIHAERTPEGCGSSENCADCALQQATAAISRGETGFRHTAAMKLERNGVISEAWFLVNGHPLVHKEEKYVIVTLEDISELVELRRIVPICSHCHKVRDDTDFWHHVEDYMQRHTGVQFSHGICPDCLREHYPEDAGSILETSANSEE